MYGLIKAVYTEDQQRSFEKVYCDSDDHDRFLLRSTLASSPKDSPAILESNGTDWILCTLCQYNHNEDDTMRVFRGMVKQLRTITIGIVDENIQFRPQEDIADSCLISVALFKEYLNQRTQRKQAPTPEYYARVGSVAFHRTGYDRIGDEFDGWAEFIKKEFTIEA